MPALWSNRSSSYKVGIGLLVLGAAAYLTGFASPFWLDVKASGVDESLYMGLWKVCITPAGAETECFSTVRGSTRGNEHTAWFKVVQSLQCVGLAFLAVACVLAVMDNVRQTARPLSRWTVSLAAAGGTCGTLGCVIFLCDITSIVPDTESVLRFLSWGFGLNASGSILFLIASAVIYTATRAGQASPGQVVMPRAQAPVAVSIQQYSPDQGYPAQPVYGYDQRGDALAQGGYTLAAVPPPRAGYGPPDYSGIGGYSEMGSASRQDPK